MEKFLKLKRYSILVIIIVSIIITIYIITSTIIGLNSVSNLNKEIKKELLNIWEKIIKIKFNTLSNFIDGYGDWTHIASRIKENKLSEEDRVSWQAGNTDKNDISAIIVKNKILVKGGLQIDNIDFILKDKAINEIYKITNMNKEAKNNNYILIRENFILLLKATPICDDYGNPYTEGIEIFGLLISDETIKDAEDFLDSTITLVEKEEKRSFLNIKVIDSFDNNIFKIFKVSPKLDLFKLIFLPLISSLLIQIIITIVIISTFLFLLKTISKLYINLRTERQNFINLFQDVDLFSNEIKNTQDLFNNFKYLLSNFDSNIEILKDNLIKIEKKTLFESENIEKVNKKMKEIIENINTILKNVENNYNNIKSEGKSIEELNKIISDIKKISEKTDLISNKLNDYAYEASKAFSISIQSVIEVENSSNTIKEISSVISSIAEKTNLLSINASIESAHSGEYGKGFAIVAQEIRKLSNDTARKAKDIIETIKVIFNKITHAVNSSKEGENKLKETLSLSFENKDNIDSLNNSIENQNNIVNNLILSTKLIILISEEIFSQLEKQKEFLLKELTDTMNTIKDFSEENKRIYSDYTTIISQLLQSLPQFKETTENSLALLEKISNFLDRFNKYKEITF